MTNKIKQNLENLVSKAKAEATQLKTAISPNLKTMAYGLTAAGCFSLVAGEMAYLYKVTNQPFFCFETAVAAAGAVIGAYLTASEIQYSIDDYKKSKIK